MEKRFQLKIFHQKSKIGISSTEIKMTKKKKMNYMCAHICFFRAAGAIWCFFFIKFCHICDGKKICCTKIYENKYIKIQKLYFFLAFYMHLVNISFLYFVFLFCFNSIQLLLEGFLWILFITYPYRILHKIVILMSKKNYLDK